MIRVADYIAQALVARGIKHVFMVTGGGAMHLNDAFGRTPGLSVVCCHHEQACSMAAESYYRLSGNMAAVNVTTGPGGTNAITGVYGAYVDSMAMIVISGQVKWETLVRSTALPLRQLGDQEVDIVTMVKGITKYSVVIEDPATVRYHLERALYLAMNARPGPVWLDVPINIQAAAVNPATLTPYNPSEDSLQYETRDLDAVVRDTASRLRAAERPAILAGTGIRLSGEYERFLRLANQLRVPVVAAWNSYDLLPDDHPAYAGRPGTIGNRAGNFTVQNADFLLILGSRLNIRMISYNWEAFARNAYKVMVDIDVAELKKPTLKIDCQVHADLRDFLPRLETCVEGWSPRHNNWLQWCRERLSRYPVVLPEYWHTEGAINPYCFMDRLFAALSEGDIIVCGDGTACVTAFQAATIRVGQRLFHNSGCAAMGYDLPAAIGAALAFPTLKRIICLAGDGSVMMNLQELQTIVGHRLPVKLFILNNSGYHSIRQTQRSFFPDNVVGCGPDSGLNFPDFGAVTRAFGLDYRRCARHAEIDATIQSTLSSTNATACEVILDLKQNFAPKVSSRRLEDGRMITAPLEDMAPFLSPEEFRTNIATASSDVG